MLSSFKTKIIDNTKELKMKLNVLYQFNETYAPYAGISMVSLMENNKGIDDIAIYIMGENLTSQSQQKLTRQVQQYDRQIHFIDTKKIIEKICQLKIPEYRGSYATNMKMFVADYVDADVDRLLYLDSDTIICEDISPLISLNMNGKPIAMVLDSLGRKYKSSIGLDEEDDYFNGGIILYDIPKWRQDRCAERIQECAKNGRFRSALPDQDLINLVLKKQIMKLDISYNLQPVHTVYTYKQYCKVFGQKKYYSEAEITSAVANPQILHTFRYLGEFPWHKNSLHPHVPYFDQYMKLSLWKDYQKQTSDQNGILFKIEHLLYRCLPRTLFLKIFKISLEIFLSKSNKVLQRQKKICIYVVSHKPFNMPVKDPMYVPLMVGNHQINFPKDWISDATGINISDKNPRYNELTGLYWIWKNSNADIVGLCHYRRFFTTPMGKIRNVFTGRADKFINKNYIKKALKSYDVILHNKTFTPEGNQNQLCIQKNDSEKRKKSKLSKELLALVDDSFKSTYPEDYLIYQKVMNRKYAHLLNIMICYKETLDRYCEWLFPLLYEIEKEIDHHFPGRPHKRCMGLIAERLLDVWVLKEGLHIKESFALNTERIDWKPW